MKGLELARRYYAEVVLPAFTEKAPGEVASMAFGLVGPGSECYGLDDEISRDHDWGPRVCVWVPEELYRQRGTELQRIYDSQERAFLGFGPVRRLDTRIRRDGILSTPRFYRTLLGTSEEPQTLRDWLLIPEEALSACTNGEIFADPAGEFTRMRAALLGYFPRDLWLKKIASRCKAAGRHGQYNLWRALRREDPAAACVHTAGFARETAALVFLLRRSYRPVDKWLFAGLEQLEEPGPAVRRLLTNLVRTADERELERAIAACAAALIEELVGQELVPPGETFLWDCGESIERSIVDPDLRERLDSVE